MAQHLSNLPLGALVKFGKHQVNAETAQPIIWRVVDKNHSGYPSNSVTLLTQNIIDLRAYDAVETISGDSWYGSAEYELSNIAQWLNSDATAGQWYTKKHSNDKPPSSGYLIFGAAYDSRPGFLYNFSSVEKQAMLPTTIKTQTGEDTSGSITSKVFIPSAWEICGTYKYADESHRFAYFASGSILCGLTSQAYANTTSADKPSTVDKNWMYMTRSTSTGDNVAFVESDGTINYASPWLGSLGVRPCVNLSTNAKISDTTDSDGCYTVLFNTAPIISGTNSDLGVITDGFTQSYTVSESDNGDTVTVSEYIDNTMVRSYVATSGATNSLKVTNTTWWGLTNGNHTLKVVANDGFDTTERIFTFTKLVNKLVVQRTTPIASTTQPKSIIVSVVKNIPTEAIFKVEACNNGFDTAPTWEDITSDVTRGEIYDFTNTTKTATQWGVNIRVTVDRNGAEGACYITEIGGNFE